MDCELVIRADTAGASHWLAEECVDRNRRLSLGYTIDDQVRLAVEASMALHDENKRRSWVPAIEADGVARDLS